MSLVCVAPPAVEPVTLSELKLQCGFGPMEDTDQLREQTLAEQMRAAIAAARQECEGLCARAFITQQWTLTLDRFPWGNWDYAPRHGHDIELPLPTFQSIAAFTYVDGAGVEQDNTAIGAWGYQLVNGSDTQAARLRPPVYRGWPLTQPDLANAVVITFNCGFGPGPTALPSAIRQAVKIHAQWLFEGGKGSRPRVVDSLLTPWIVDLV